MLYVQFREDEFNDESEITMIRGCNHIFNRGSLREWFVNHSTCPMCRNDIREYRPSSASLSTSALPQNDPPSISIDRIDDNEITFSYDIPIHYNNEQVFNNIVNTITNMTQTSQPNPEAPPLDDDDDIMEVD